MSKDTITGLLVMFGMAVFMGLMLAPLYEEDIRKDKEDASLTFVLKLHIFRTVSMGLITGVSFLLGVVMIVLSYVVVDSVWGKVAGVFFFLFGMFLSLNFLLFVNHFFHELLRKVTMDKVNNKLIIEKSGKTHTVDLTNDQYEVIEYRPRQGRRGMRPGAEFGKIVIVKGGRKFEFSELVFENYKHVFDKVIMDREVTVIKRQLNWFV